jgi:hypothetical protein
VPVLKLQGAAPRHVDHRYPAFGRVAAVVANPQPVLVRLQGHAQRLVAGVQVGHAGEGFGVDHRHLAALGDRHEHLLVVAGGHPVHGPPGRSMRAMVLVTPPTDTVGSITVRLASLFSTSRK